MAVIYQITNMENGKYYIGSAQSFEKRCWQHRTDLRRQVHKNKHLQAAWNKYGEYAFVFEILEQCEDSEQYRIEDMYLCQHVGKPECYNINTGAINSRGSIPHTQISKDRISASRIGKHSGEEHYRFGKQVSAEVRAKIRATQKGKPNKMKGKKMSEEGRANVIAAIKRGEDSHFYGKRPEHSDSMRRAVKVVKRDGSEETYEGLSVLRDSEHVTIDTIIRACKTGKKIRSGPCDGWVMAYAEAALPSPIEIPEEYAHLPRTRQEAKERGAAEYFTGVPCSRGHIAPRRVKGVCRVCGREDDAEYRKNKLTHP